MDHEVVDLGNNETPKRSEMSLYYVYWGSFVFMVVSFGERREVMGGSHPWTKKKYKGGCKKRFVRNL